MMDLFSPFSPIAVTNIDQNLPDLSGIPDFFIYQMFFFLDMVTVTLVVP